jgi:hypothetical protein
VDGVASWKDAAGANGAQWCSRIDGNANVAFFERDDWRQNLGIHLPGFVPFIHPLTAQY